MWQPRDAIAKESVLNTCSILTTSRTSIYNYLITIIDVLLKIHHRLTLSHLNMILMALNLYKDLFIEWKISFIFLAHQKSPALMEVSVIGLSTLVQDSAREYKYRPTESRNNLIVDVPKSSIKLRCVSLMWSLILLKWTPIFRVVYHKAWSSTMDTKKTRVTMGLDYVLKGQTPS